MRIRHERPHLVLVLAVLALIGAPILGSYIRCGGLPPQFPTFPVPREAVPKPGFSPLLFAAACLVAAVLTAFLVVPRWFGFERRPKALRPRPRKPLPTWFWGGAAVNLVSWALMWFGPASIAKFTFVPLWWGFILALDGVVYARRGGRSILGTNPRRLLLLALVSVPTWTLFEYMNYFALEFWVYPNREIFSPGAQAFWFFLSFSTVWPTVFVWYTLLRSFEGLWGRWRHGPKISVSSRLSGLVAATGFVALVLFAIFPFQLFVLLWVAPPLLLIGVLSGLGFWTPLKPIADGNWSPAVVMGLAALCNGFFWELWNYGSRYFQAPEVTNPNYWYYRIPYVDTGHFFSEMPILGYFGYLPFGVLAWLCWLVVAHMFDLGPDFEASPGEGAAPGSLGAASGARVTTTSA